MFRKPIGIAYDTAEDCLIVVCNDGAVFQTGLGMPWGEIQSIPGTERFFAEEQKNEEAADAPRA